ncbi:hypothetical protein CR513_09502, partial [Mucuna pruriens]
MKIISSTIFIINNLIIFTIQIYFDFDGSKKTFNLKGRKLKLIPFNLSINRLTTNIDFNMLGISINFVCQEGENTYMDLLTLSSFRLLRDKLGVIN